jgi:hypothetical protein
VQRDQISAGLRCSSIADSVVDVLQCKVLLEVRMLRLVLSSVRDSVAVCYQC